MPKQSNPPPTRPTKQPPSCADAAYLQLALQQAQQAAAMGEVPVGAVLVSPTGQVLAQAHNCTVSRHDPSAHAEVLTLRAAAQKLGNYRLDGCTLYITLEPCTMCSGAVLHARLARVVYAIAEPKTGAAESVLNIFNNRQLNHQTRVEAFTPQNTHELALQARCAQVLSAFFDARRTAAQEKRKQARHAAVREDALRPPLHAFSGISSWQSLENYSHFALLQDKACTPKQPQPWRMHYLEAANSTDDNPNGKPTIVLLHGYAASSLLWAPLLQPLAQAGWRVLAPDLLGHGKSDQPKKTRQHQAHWHAHMLAQWLAQMCFGQYAQQNVLLVHDSSALLLPILIRYISQNTQNTDTPQCKQLHVWHIASQESAQTAQWRRYCAHKPSFDLDKHWAFNANEAQQKAWSAPYPNSGHRAALQWAAFAQLMAPIHTLNGLAAHQNLHVYTHPALVAPSGASFRQWLVQSSAVLLQKLQAIA